MSSFFWKVVWLDAPYIIDSFTRHADYDLNRLHPRELNGRTTPTRSPLMRPPFWLLVVVLFFTAYGPTYSSLCGFGSPRLVAVGTDIFAIVLIVASIFQAGMSIGNAFGLIDRRFDKAKPPRTGARYKLTRIVFISVGIVWASPLTFLGIHTWRGMDIGCHRQSSPWPAIIQLASFAAAVAIAAAVLLFRKKTLSIFRRLALETALIAALVLMTFWTSGSTRSEAAQLPYPHVFGIIALGMAAVATMSTWLIKGPFGSVSEREWRSARNALERIELFAPPRRDPELSVRRVVGGFVTTLMARPLHFLVLPAFTGLLAPSEHVTAFCVIAAGFSVLLLAAGSLTSRWDRMLEYLRRYFLLGTPLAVSMVVIIVAMLRLAGVQYVTTLLNVAPFGILFVWMVMAYALCWWFEYEANSILAAEMLALFGAQTGRDDELVPYVLRPNVFRQKLVSLDDRYLTGHGMGELIVVGRRKGNPGSLRYAFEAYGFIDLIQKLLGRSRPEQAHELIRRAQLYFSLVNVLLVAGFCALAWNLGRGDRFNTVAAVVTANQPPKAEDEPADLATLLRQDPGHPRQSAIVVSASGGGTRAALYTAVTLEGLHKLHVDERVVLLSGVSGGAVASAYFYGHREDLVHDRQTKCGEGDSEPESAWDCYMERMRLPFIEEVLRGASEWRIQSEQPLGVLLSESFERELFQGDSMNIASRSDVGLILNTTVSGHPLQDVPALEGTLARSVERQSEDCEWPVSALGGGRLAFSNLAGIWAFNKSEAQAPSINMPFVVLRDRSIELARAAALSANFPPVFPNARVNVTGFRNVGKPCDVRTYFVTDGGATENLSLLSALLAIDSAFHDMPPDVQVRPIDIVLSEASALQFDYSQDRGIGAATDQSKERLTGRLTLELLERLRKRATINIHDLSLPRVFRSRGGFGTHWEMPRSIHLEDPLDPPPTTDWGRLAWHFDAAHRTLSLNRTELVEVWRALYDKDSAFCGRTWKDAPNGALATTADWICGHEPQDRPRAKPDPQLERWSALKAALAASSPASAGSP